MLGGPATTQAVPRIIIYAAPGCGACRRVKRWFAERNIPFVEVNIARETQAIPTVRRLAGEKIHIPVIVFPDGAVLIAPGDHDLAARCFPDDPPQEKEVQMSAQTNQANQTNQAKRRIDKASQVSYPRFAGFYNRLMDGAAIRQRYDPWRRELVGEAQGVVLEIGPGGGQNFPFYDPGQVERVEAVEPDLAMLANARRSAEQSAVPITLTQAPVEDLPFADTSFDSVVATLVFCSVGNPAQGLREIARVLKPGGALLLLEHVRSPHGWIAGLQTAMVPVTTRFFGNDCWNRDTARAVQEAGFHVTHQRQVSGGLVPHIVLKAVRP